MFLVVFAPFQCLCFCLYVLFDFPELCFVYVTCLGFVSFWFGYVGLTVFICVGVVPFTCLFTCCNSVCGACSIWSRVFRVCVFSFAFYICSALMCFLSFFPYFTFVFCILFLYVLCWLCVLHHIVSLRFGMFCVLGMRVCV